MRRTSVTRPRLGPHPPRFQRRVQLSGSQRRLLPGQPAGDRRRQRCPTTRRRVKRLSAGCSVDRRGRVKESGGKGQATELHAERGHRPRLGRSGDLSAAEEAAFVREAPRVGPSAAPDQHVRRRGAGPQRICRSIHDFFQEEGFLYVHTPIITASDCEGAGEMFRVTTLDLDESAARPEGEVDFAQDFFDRPAFLTVSGQLEGGDLRLALGKVYTFGPTFRAENSNTSRHLAEFWMVEPEMAFYRSRRQHGPGRSVPQTDLSRDVLERLPRRYGVLQPADRQDRRRRRCRAIVDSRFSAAHLHRGGRHPEQARQRRSNSRSPGAPICSPNTNGF